MPKTVKVKIAVAVDPTGNWYCAGWPDGNEDNMMNIADVGEARYFITAELEIPEEKKPIEVKTSKIERIIE